MIDKNRTNNFRIGDGQLYDRTSVTKAVYDYKSGERGALNEVQKKDLKATHFVMGSHIHDYNASS